MHTSLRTNTGELKLTRLANYLTLSIEVDGVTVTDSVQSDRLAEWLRQSTEMVAEFQQDCDMVASLTRRPT